jgi:hypothetical protein
MSNYLITLYAPPRVVSPDPECAELVVSAANLDEAKEAAERLVDAETESLETYVEWHGDHYVQGLPFAIGMHVVSVEATSRKAELTASEIK